MQPGLSSNHFRSSLVAHAIDAASRLEYAAIEVWIEHLWETGEDCGTVRRLAEARNLSLSVHGPICEVNVTSRNAGIREESRRQYHRAIETSARLGAEVLVLHPGAISPGDTPSDSYWDALVECFAGISETADRHGIKIGIEHMETKPSERVVHPADVLHLVRSIGRPTLGLTLDIAHLLFSGQTADIPSLKPNLLNVHISGSTKTHPHVPLREAIYDLRPPLHSLATVYQGIVVIEGRVSGKEMETVTSNREIFDELIRGLS